MHLKIHSIFVLSYLLKILVNKSIKRSAKDSSEPYSLSKITCLLIKSSKINAESLILSDKSLTLILALLKTFSINSVVPSISFCVILSNSVAVSVLLIIGEKVDSN